MEEPITPVEVRTILERVMPIETERCSLHLAGEEEGVVFEKEGWLMVVLRLIVWDVGEVRTIRDVKEQYVGILRDKDRGRRAQLESYLVGWAAAVRRVFETAPRNVEVLMPHDLVAPAILGLKKLREPAAFESAALVKSRLGKWIV